MIIEEAFAVNIPRFRHGEGRCVDAKEAELEKFDELKEANERESKMIDSKDIGEMYFDDISMENIVHEMTNAHYKENAVERTGKWRKLGRKQKTQG